MDKIAAAFVTYAGFVAAIYGLGAAAEDALSKHARDAIFRHRRHTISTALANIISITISIVDSAMRYRKVRAFWVPSFWRSVVFSLLMLVIVAYPLNSILDSSLPIVSGIALKTYLTALFHSLAVFALVAAALAMNTLVDYLSFIKTRTLIHWFYRIAFPRREFLILICDILLSLVICVVVYSIGWFSIIFIAYLHEIADSSVLEYAGAVYRLAWKSFVIPLPILLVSFVTSLGIGTLSILIIVIEAACAAIRALENARLWSLLNFEKKPMIASAAAVIIVISVVYWPTILLTILL